MYSAGIHKRHLNAFFAVRVRPAAFVSGIKVHSPDHGGGQANEDARDLEAHELDAMCLRYEFFAISINFCYYFCMYNGLYGLWVSSSVSRAEHRSKKRPFHDLRGPVGCCPDSVFDGFINALLG